MTDDKNKMIDDDNLKYAKLIRNSYYNFSDSIYKNTGKTFTKDDFYKFFKDAGFTSSDKIHEQGTSINSSDSLNFEPYFNKLVDLLVENYKNVIADVKKEISIGKDTDSTEGTDSGIPDYFTELDSYLDAYIQGINSLHGVNDEYVHDLVEKAGFKFESDTFHSYSGDSTEDFKNKLTKYSELINEFVSDPSVPDSVPYMPRNQENVEKVPETNSSNVAAVTSSLGSSIFAAMQAHQDSFDEDDSDDDVVIGTPDEGVASGAQEKDVANKIRRSASRRDEINRSSYLQNFKINNPDADEVEILKKRHEIAQLESKALEDAANAEAELAAENSRKRKEKQKEDADAKKAAELEAKIAKEKADAESRALKEQADLAAKSQKELDNSKTELYNIWKSNNAGASLREQREKKTEIDSLSRDDLLKGISDELNRNDAIRAQRKADEEQKIKDADEARLNKERLDAENRAQKERADAEARALKEQADLAAKAQKELDNSKTELYNIWKSNNAGVSIREQRDKRTEIDSLSLDDVLKGISDELDRNDALRAKRQADDEQRAKDTADAQAEKVRADITAKEEAKAQKDADKAKSDLYTVWRANTPKASLSEQYTKKAEISNMAITDVVDALQNEFKINDEIVATEQLSDATKEFEKATENYAKLADDIRKSDLERTKDTMSVISDTFNYLFADVPGLETFGKDISMLFSQLGKSVGIFRSMASRQNAVSALSERSDAVSAAGSRVSSLSGDTPTQDVPVDTGTVDTLQDTTSGVADLAESTDELGAVAGATSTSASTATTALSSSAIAFGAVVAASALAVAGIALLVKTMYDLGEAGFETERQTAQASLVLGTFFDEAMSRAEKIEADTGLSTDRTMSGFASLTSAFKGAGYNQEEAVNRGTELGEFASNLAYNTGHEFENVVSDMQSAITNADSDSLSKYGIEMSENAIRAFYEQQTGISQKADLSEEQQTEANLLYIRQQLVTLGQQEVTDKNTLIQTQAHLKNTWDSLVKKLQTVFIPVFDAVVTALDKFVDGLIGVVNWVRDLFGKEPLSLDKVVNPETVDAAQSTFTDFKRAGDEAAAFMSQLYGFDEINQHSAFENAEIDDTGYDDSPILGVLDDIRDNMPTSDDVKNIEPGDNPNYGYLGNLLQDTFNTDKKAWDDMTEKEQRRDNPTKNLAEGIKSGDYSGTDVIKDLLSMSFENIPFIQGIKDFQAGDWLGGILNTLGNFFMPGGVLINYLSNWLQDGINLIGKLITGDSNWALDITQMLQSVVEAFLTGIWTVIDAVFSAGVTIGAFIGALAENVLQLIVALGAGIVFTIGLIIDFIVLIFKSIYLLVTGNFDDLFDAWSDFGVKFKNSWDWLLGVWGELWKKAGDTWLKFADVFNNIWTGFIDRVTKVANFLDFGKSAREEKDSLNNSTTTRWGYTYSNVTESADVYNYSGGGSGGGTRGLETPHYADGGLALRPHQAVVGDVAGGELALPISSASAQPFYDRVGDRILGSMSNTTPQSSSSLTVNVTAGTVIGSNKYEMKKFAESIAKMVTEKQHSTGGYEFGTR